MFVQQDLFQIEHCFRLVVVANGAVTLGFCLSQGAEHGKKCDFPLILNALNINNSRLCELRIDYLIEDG